MEKKGTKDMKTEIRQQDDVEDVNIYLAVPIVVMAGVASIAAILAILAMAFYEYFRKDLSAYWMACIPFIFPFITALAAAWRKRVTMLAIHVSVLMAVQLFGSAAYAYSVGPVFVERNNCTAVIETRGSCHKEPLAYLFLFSGAAAVGFNGLELLLSIFTWVNSALRRSKRKYLIELQLQQNEVKKIHEMKAAAMEPIAHTASDLPTSVAMSNGIEMVSYQNHQNHSGTTKLPLATNSSTHS